MIKKLTKEEYNKIVNFTSKDNLRNYFIRLTLMTGMDGFKAIYGQYINEILVALIFHRKSDNIQIYAEGKEDPNEISAYLSKMEFGKIISARSFCDRLDLSLFKSIEYGAYHAELTDQDKLQNQYALYLGSGELDGIEALTIEDLDQVVEIYKKNFKGFSSKEVMAEKLKTNRGRGFVIKEKACVVSVVQTEFETPNSAVIVAVATEPDYQGQGLASRLLAYTSKLLLEEGKRLYLQYDNLDAGRIYKRLGFENFDQIGHYYKI